MARKPKGEKIDGWIVLDKPVGLTSTDCVTRVRRLFNAEKAGHAGTLDPLATGILAIALGEATKTVAFAMDALKTYRFTARWGISTTTDDAEGKVSAESPVRPAATDILSALPGFVGAIQQTPPVFSAIKVDGARAYDLARMGEMVELKPRPAYIARLELCSMPDKDHTVFEMTTGKGVYVRSLVRDLAARLGACAHVAALRRTQTGAFLEQGAISLEALSELHYSGGAEKHLHPVETALDDIPALAIGEADTAKVRSGQAVPVRGSAFAIAEAILRDAGDEPPVVLLKSSESRRPVAMAELRLGAFHPVRVFNL
jgi:tRNA pseudouridine55 synthase